MRTNESELGQEAPAAWRAWGGALAAVWPALVLIEYVRRVLRPAMEHLLGG